MAREFALADISPTFRGNGQASDVGTQEYYAA
jgi:hypothetical protein